jgi:hypothetical protein
MPLGGPAKARANAGWAKNRVPDAEIVRRYGVGEKLSIIFPARSAGRQQLARFLPLHQLLADPLLGQRHHLNAAVQRLDARAPQNHPSAAPRRAARTRGPPGWLE